MEKINNNEVAARLINFALQSEITGYDTTDFQELKNAFIGKRANRAKADKWLLFLKNTSLPTYRLYLEIIKELPFHKLAPLATSNDKLSLFDICYCLFLFSGAVLLLAFAVALIFTVFGA